MQHKIFRLSDFLTFALHDCIISWNFKLVSKWSLFSLDPTPWGPIGQFWMLNGRLWNPKLTPKVNGLWIKIKAQNFASQVFKYSHLQNLKQKRISDFFYHITYSTLKCYLSYLSHFKTSTCSLYEKKNDVYYFQISLFVPEIFKFFNMEICICHPS